MSETRPAFLAWLNGSAYAGAGYEAGELAWTAWQAAEENQRTARMTATVEEVRRAHVEQVLAASPTQMQAAKTLGVDMATLYRWRKRWGLA